MSPKVSLLIPGVTILIASLAWHVLRPGPAPQPDVAEHWKLGVFYFNPDDARLFVPKRQPGFGWTLNHANPWSIAVYGMLFLGGWLVTALNLLVRRHAL